jgi:flagellum-specific peptidoglycan hydrolase FlgJ
MAALSKSLVIGWRGLIFWLLLAWLFLTLSKTKNPPKKMISINETFFHYIFPRIVAAGFRGELAKYVFAQAAFETGNFTSDIFKENNNLFGMKLPRVRQTLATGENRGHATFNSITDSIKDFALFHKARALAPSFTSIDTYIETLNNKGYFEAPETQYSEGVKTYYNAYFM